MVLIALIIPFVSILGWKLLSKINSSPVSPRSSDKPSISIKGMVFYTNQWHYYGGNCSYYAFDEKGTITSYCVDDDSALEAIKTIKRSDNSYSNKLIKITADVHTVTLVTTPFTPKRQYSETDFYVIDKLYSAELTNIESK